MKTWLKKITPILALGIFALGGCGNDDISIDEGKIKDEAAAQQVDTARWFYDLATRDS